MAGHRAHRVLSKIVTAPVTPELGRAADELDHWIERRGPCRAGWFHQAEPLSPPRVDLCVGRDGPVA